MADRPIIFSGPMVRAILDGCKTQTRRVVKPHRGFEHHSICSPSMAADSWAVWWHYLDCDRVGHLAACPYGVPGDRLWVKETYGSLLEDSRTDSECIVYRADEEIDGMVWSPSMFMPRRYSRLTLTIKSVRVERVQDISEADAKAEGISVLPLQDESDPSAWYQSEPGVHQGRSARASYAMLWDSINAKRGYSWESNPWAWVIEFERQEVPRG